jgi:hypothetical protein
MSATVGTRRHTLAEYQRHAELYGSESVLETAAGDLDERGLGELAAFVGHLERVAVFRHGQWVHHGQEVRVCEECGKDLPKGASRRMRRHPHCRTKASERRKATATAVA